jgi:hypothetical protein
MISSDRYSPTQVLLTVFFSPHLPILASSYGDGVFVSLWSLTTILQLHRGIGAPGERPLIIDTDDCITL